MLALGGGTKLAVMTTTGSERTLDLKVGDAVRALIKATHDILGVD
ncbi:MAG: TOBE domain-containing protein [Thiomonas sp.]